MYVVTGAAGLIGGNLIRELIKQNKPVRAVVHHDQRSLENLDIEIVYADVLDVDSLVKAFQSAQYVFHLAGLISIGKNSANLMKSINVNGVANIIQACKRSNIKRLIHFSSIHALDQNPHSLPVTENNSPALGSKHGPYDRSKAQGEQLVRKAMQEGLDAVVIYPTGVLGPFDFSPSHLGEAIVMMAEGKLPALVEGGFNWVDVRDVVHTSIYAAENAPAGSRYLLGGHWCSVADICLIVSVHTGVKYPKLTLPLWVAYLGLPFINLATAALKARPLYTKVSLDALRSNRNIAISEATKDLNYTPRPFDETIIDTLDWFTQNGYIGTKKKVRE